MIKIKSVHIEETRGIRKLTLSPEQKNISISGPNGSGKSGVIDAIEFALTGDIKRLAGSGTKGITVTEHGPHVDKVKFPEASFVTLEVHIPALNKFATIKRNINKPKKPDIQPNTEEIQNVFAAIASHPEITLSRRDIVRFILVGPTDRSTEIQTLLKLNRLGETRSALNTVLNSIKKKHNIAKAKKDSAKTQLTLHSQIDKLSSKKLLDIVNSKRKILGLDSISKLTSRTQIDEGIRTASSSSKLNKTSELKRIEDLVNTLAEIDKIASPDLQIIASGVCELRNDVSLLAMIQQQVLIENGIELIDGPNCPLCDQDWESERHLRDHLTSKLKKSKEANELKNKLFSSSEKIRILIQGITAKLNSVVEIAKYDEITAKKEVAAIVKWKNKLEDLSKSLETIEHLFEFSAQIETGWIDMPSDINDHVGKINSLVKSLPDQTATDEARTFLITAQVRLTDYRLSMNECQPLDEAEIFAKQAYTTFCNVMEEELIALYEEVQSDFSSYYREINGDDESSFTAKFTPTEGALKFDVNFYERGLFPPGAYHSEGHQDGMGVCLYLALMKKLYGEKFTLALLDDVVMSVDSGHRYQFCKLLKKDFPNTQFILTTHDRLWAQQMRSAQLVPSSNAISFHSWSVDTGPLIASSLEVWNEIEIDLNKGKIESAAHTLRHHLEYCASQLCDELGASVRFQSDGNYDLGTLLPAAQKCLKSLLSKASNSAQSWGHTESFELIKEKKLALSTSSGASQLEQWAINKGVHYNEWANFGKTDFTPVVVSFKELLECFSCSECNSWLYTTPKVNPESLRCRCGTNNLNLKPK